MIRQTTFPLLVGHGYVAGQLTSLGFNQFEVGLLGKVTLTGSALAIVAVRSIGEVESGGSVFRMTFPLSAQPS